MVARAVKFGLVVLGIVLLNFLVLAVALGGIGPCASTGQMMALLLGLGLTILAICGSSNLIDISSGGWYVLAIFIALPYALREKIYSWISL